MKPVDKPETNVPMKSDSPKKSSVGSKIGTIVIVIVLLFILAIFIMAFLKR